MIMLTVPMCAVVMAAAIREQSVGVTISVMQHLVHDYVNDESANCSDEHDHRLLHKLLVYDPVG